MKSYEIQWMCCNTVSLGCFYLVVPPVASVVAVVPVAPGDIVEALAADEIVEALAAAPQPRCTVCIGFPRGFHRIS